MANPHVPGNRRLNSDGTIDVHCKICGNFICRQMYKGYSTAICHWCANDIPRPLEEDPNPATVNLYNEEESEKQRSGAYGLSGFAFKAVSLLKKVFKPKPTSEKIAGAKKRRPLFEKAKGEEKPDEG